jgi:hypothetical protein
MRNTLKPAAGEKDFPENGIPLKLQEKVELKSMKGTH